MCTLMQKEALIERVASVQALISRKTPLSDERTPDQIHIAQLRGFLYDHDPEEIDFQMVADECNELYLKYSAISTSEW